MVSLTDLAANPELLIAYQRQQAARRRAEQDMQADAPRTPGATWMSALTQALGHVQAERADQRFQQVAREQRDREAAEIAAFQGVLGKLPGGQEPALAPPASVTREALPAPAAAPSVGRYGGPAASLADDRSAPDYDPVAASRRRLALTGGAPEIPGGYRAPAGVDGAFAGLAPPSGVINANIGPGPSPPPASGAPNPALLQQAQAAALHSNPRVRAMAPLLMAQYERQQQDARLAQQTARDDERFRFQMAAQARADERAAAADARALRETFGPPVQMMVNGQPAMVQVGSTGTVRPLPGAAPMPERAPAGSPFGGGTIGAAAQVMMQIGPMIEAGTASPAQIQQFRMATDIYQRETYNPATGARDAGLPLPPEVRRQLSLIPGTPSAEAPVAAASPAGASGNVLAAPAAPQVTETGSSRIVQPPQVTPQAREAARKMEVEVGRVNAAIEGFRTALRETGGTGINSFLNNPRDPAATRLNAAFSNLTTALRSEAFLNTGVLQPGEIVIIDRMLLNPQSLRGLLASNEGYDGLLNEIQRFVFEGQNTARRSAGLPLAPLPEHLRPRASGNGGMIERARERNAAQPPGTGGGWSIEQVR